MPDLRFRFFSGRSIPIGTVLKCYVTGALTVVEGRVPGGRLVVTPCPVVDGVIVLDDALFFENENAKLSAGLIT